MVYMNLQAAAGKRRRDGLQHDRFYYTPPETENRIEIAIYWLKQDRNCYVERDVKLSHPKSCSYAIMFDEMSVRAVSCHWEITGLYMGVYRIAGCTVDKN